MGNCGSPARYEVRVEGTLHASWFPGLHVVSEGGQTVISGGLADQCALHGVLVRIRDLGLCLTSVQRLELDVTTPGSASIKQQRRTSWR